MKVRIGFGLGVRQGFDAGTFATLVDALEREGFDSLWLSERVAGDAPDPLAALGVAAGRTRRLKLGTSVLVLPGRPPALLATELATLDVLSGGRVLPAFGLGAPQAAEHQAFGVARPERAAWFDEALPLLRRLWSEDTVDHHGARFHYDAVRVRPHPVQRPLDLWLGGRGPSELRRTGRLGDGWLASFSTPEQCAAARPVIQAAAAEAGREIDPEHYGAIVPYASGALPDGLRAVAAARNAAVDPTELVAIGLDAIAPRLEQYLEVGFSKLVLVPVTPATDWGDEVAAAAAVALPLQR